MTGDNDSVTSTGPPSRSAALADLAGLLADRTRAAFCLALLDGRAWTAGELARHAGVSASTATAHLNRLVERGLLAEHRQGRHRYLRLAEPGTAQLLEDLVAAAGPVTGSPQGMRAVTTSTALARARTCYDHLAGRLGVAITDAMTRSGLLDQTGGVALTDAGRAWLSGPLGVDPAALRTTRRPLVRLCIDWTERRPHLAGVVGATVCRCLLERGWVRRIGSGRAVRLTPSGQAALTGLLDLPDIDG